jgi:transcription initiation factor TFIIH subunit 3
VTLTANYTSGLSQADAPLSRGTRYLVWHIFKEAQTRENENILDLSIIGFPGKGSPFQGKDRKKAGWKAWTTHSTTRVCQLVSLLQESISHAILLAGVDTAHDLSMETRMDEAERLLAAGGTYPWDIADQKLEQSPSLLVVILDTNPGAWYLLSDTLTLSSAVSSLVVFINAHLACNYTNKVAVIASHSNKAKWLYPSSDEQHDPAQQTEKRRADDDAAADQILDSAKRLKINGPGSSNLNGTKKSLPYGGNPSGPASSNKFRQFRLVEEELIRNLTTLLTSTTPSHILNSTSTMIAGALTLGLSYINREKVAYAESTGSSNAEATANQTTTDPTTVSSRNAAFQSRILLLSVSPSTDIAHQYIPIMNCIFACQRLSIPVDICQIPLPNTSATSTVFLQQAADATKGIYIPIRLESSSSDTRSKTMSLILLQYLLTAFLPSPQSSRLHLILPTSISVDFRAACFCHRNVVDIGFVCSICLSIFCAPPPDGDCLTCSTHLKIDDHGQHPIVVGRKKKKKSRIGPGALDGRGSGVSTPTPG